MAWDEWERMKDAAAGQDSTAMRLNQADAGGGGGGGPFGDLVVNQDDLGAVGHDAFVLHSQLHKQADIAGAGAGKDGVGSTAQAAADLKSGSFSLGPALATTVEMWTSQVKSVLQACAHISNHLDYTKRLHAVDDVKIAADLPDLDGLPLPVSRLNEYFK
ncbi:hypothetical protein QR77_31715 [Streptomyces sp. 150FB]|uniref:hypothetical protein n=1 Tax=Streptomyces sp. 150FB TaxID=1576605 RepID=UPI00058936D6|nr:hypothetical protein [Streptomyces sp. 150FB]KIF79340.1 hypothetical protein QR77_31715 [Streptomyces sp. 150FB]